MLTDFKTWRNPDRILKACTLAVFDREDFFTDYDGEKEYFRRQFNTEFVKLSYKGKSFSSTKIRVYSAFGLPIDNLLDGKLVEYIKKTALYTGDKYIEYVKGVLPQKRLKHTADVVITALGKVKELSLDREKVMMAATLHDCAKYFDKSFFPNFKLPDGVPQPVVHAFLGEYIARTVLGIEDSEILDAIKYHTSGKPDMSRISKLVFVADMVEEGRTYDGVEYLRTLYEKEDFEFCFKECLKEEVLHLINKKQYIYSLTLDAYDYYCK
jgi:predicted HD superfamily hydrolase involved in NAD metabolism